MHDSPFAIAMVSEHASPLADDIGGTDSGGQNIYVRELALALAAEGHVVTVFTRRTSARQPDRVNLAEGVEVVHVAAGPARALPKEDLAPLMGDFGDQLALHWQEHTPDIVHAHYWMSGIAALAGARRTSIPVVTTFHALGLERLIHHPNNNPNHLEKERVEFERSVGHNVDGVIALTPEEVGYLTGQYGISRSKIAVVPVGMNPARFTPRGAAFSRSGRLRVVAVGRLVERKGLSIVIGALAQVRAQVDVELVIAGGPSPGALGGSSEVRTLRDQARELGSRRTSTFLVGSPMAMFPGSFGRLTSSSVLRTTSRSGRPRSKRALAGCLSSPPLSGG